MDLEKFGKKAQELGVLGVVVTQNGKEIGKKLWDEECRRNVYSVTKSFTSAAVGIAQKEGLLSLDEKLVDCFPDELPEHISENLAKATVKDLLTMCLGQKESELMAAQRPLYTERNWVKLSLTFPFEYEPGTRFVYNNVGPYLAGVLVQRRAGCNLASYLEPRLFEPLGIIHPTWEEDPVGYHFGSSGLFLTMSEMHRFGLLYLQNGSWNGKQLIPEEWVKESTRKQVENSFDEYGYGYLFWRGKENTFRADGKYCQWSIVSREKNAVISLVSECRRNEELMNAVFQDIFTQL